MLLRMLHGILQGAAAQDVDHGLLTSVFEIGHQQRLGQLPLAEEVPAEGHVLDRAGVDVGAQLRERIQHGGDAALVRAAHGVVGVGHGLISLPAVGGGGGEPAQDGVGFVVDDDHEVRVELRQGAHLPDGVADEFMEVRCQRIHLIQVVAVLLRPQQQLPLRFKALEVGLQSLQEPLPADHLPVIDQVLDGEEAVGGVDVAVGLQGAAQVGDAAGADALAPLQATFHEHGDVEEFAHLAADIVFQLLLDGKGPDIVPELFLVGAVEFFEGTKVCELAQFQAQVLLIPQVEATEEGHFQGLEHVDDAVGGADAPLVQHIFAAAEEYVVLRFLLGDVEGLHDRGDVHIVIVEHGVELALADDLQGFVHEGGVLTLVKAQGQLRFCLGGAAGGLHSEHGELIGGGFVLTALAADDHAAVEDGLPGIDQEPEGAEQLQGLFLRDPAGLQVRFQESAHIVIHAAVIQDAALKAVEPCQLKGLQEGPGRLLGDPQERLTEFGIGAAISVPAADLTKGVQGDQAGFVEGAVPKGTDQVFHAPDAQLQEPVIVHIGAHHPVEGEGDLGMLPVDVLGQGLCHIFGEPGPDLGAGLLGLPEGEHLPGHGDQLLVSALFFQLQQRPVLIQEPADTAAQQRLVGEAHVHHPLPSGQQVAFLHGGELIAALDFQTLCLPQSRGSAHIFPVHPGEFSEIFVKGHRITSRRF